MPEKPEERQSATLNDVVIGNMYHPGALTELLEEAGIVTKEQVLERIKRVSEKK